jgi:hypothetical protein
LSLDFCRTGSLAGVFFFVVVTDSVDEGVDLFFSIVEDIEVGVAIAMSALVVNVGGLCFSLEHTGALPRLDFVFVCPPFLFLFIL